MKKARRKQILEIMLERLEFKKENKCFLFLCHTLDSFCFNDKITYPEKEQMVDYIFDNKPKYNSKLMCPVAKEWYSYAEEYYRVTDEFPIWNKDNYDQRKAWLLLHIKKNS